MSMVWNVMAPVVALVRADTAEDAIRKLQEQIRKAGLEPHAEGADAFESEDVPDDVVEKW